MIELLNNLLSLSTENEVVEFKEAKNQFDKNQLRNMLQKIKRNSIIEVDDKRRWKLV